MKNLNYGPISKNTADLIKEMQQSASGVKLYNHHLVFQAGEDEPEYIIDAISPVEEAFTKENVLSQLYTIYGNSSILMNCTGYLEGGSYSLFQVGEAYVEQTEVEESYEYTSTIQIVVFETEVETGNPDYDAGHLNEDYNLPDLASDDVSELQIN